MVVVDAGGGGGWLRLVVVKDFAKPGFLASGGAWKQVGIAAAQEGFGSSSLNADAENVPPTC